MRSSLVAGGSDFDLVDLDGPLGPVGATRLSGLMLATPPYELSSLDLRWLKTVCAKQISMSRLFGKL